MTENQQLKACLHWALIHLQNLAEYTKEDVREFADGKRWWKISCGLLDLEPDLRPYIEDKTSDG